MRRSDLYQITLICSGVVATALFGVFFYRELFPEYRIYQDDYVALEKFRSSYSGEPAPAFKEEVKQIVIERDDKGPPVIDRCISCHVALQVEAFSPTKIARDINGHLVVDTAGLPVLIENENYIWKKLDQKIAALTDDQVNAQLNAQGKASEIKQRLKEAESLASLKTAQVGDHVYDVTKVLAMHPLLGKETRPFEFHSIEEYGCVSCHSGNGRGLTTEKAHGPLFDQQYEIEDMGPKPSFLELDDKNDPPFARMFNDKPGHELLFQTTPIFVGALIQSKCVQCHQSSVDTLHSAANTANFVAMRKVQTVQAIQKGLANDKQALNALLALETELSKEGLTKTLTDLRQRSQDYTLSQAMQDQYATQLKTVTQIAGIIPTNASASEIQKKQQLIEVQLDQEIQALIGNAKLVEQLKAEIGTQSSDLHQTTENALDQFLAAHRQDPKATGSLFAKMAAADLQNKMVSHVNEANESIKNTVADQNVLLAIHSDVDHLTANYQEGQQLFVSQACYACHRISGLARGGVGPELTHIGANYPWYIKEKIVWPQGNLKTSTMPNFRLDHEEIEDLMTFLLGQNGENKAVSDTGYRTIIQEWESGRNKQDWEKPITPAQMHDLRYSMTVFATQGCASCHRLKGFESDVGFKIEQDAKTSPNFAALYKEEEWFAHLFPEDIVGSEIVAALDKHSAEIDAHIVDHVRQGSILEEIDQNHPGIIEAYYASFKYAMRAKDSEYQSLIDKETDATKKQALKEQLQQWQARVNRVRMLYIQQYGLGRVIGPRPNWSGIYRSDEWLMEHFHNPAGHVARSIMPIFPFDDTKFYALTYMLDKLAIRNRDDVRAIWTLKGFDPELAVQIFCTQCHGEFLKGNGLVSEWIYPIPKNLHNAEFLRNYTKERVIQSITHGVKGTPMPPWGEVAPGKEGDQKLSMIPVLSHEEIKQIADWLFSSLPGGKVIENSGEVPKWNYSPQDVIDELKGEERHLAPEFNQKPSKNPEKPSAPEFSSNKEQRKATALATLPKGEGYYASLPDSFIGLVVTQPTETALEQSVVPEQSVLEIADLFEIKSPPISGPETHAYYIKKKFYTETNLIAGQKFFELNCAVCHGKEADGTGMRAGVMLDAKPRMLVNLDWLNSRDDLRLLRSIKYGVPGTAMTPWGDLTSSLQRIQLVVYIRSLSLEREKRDTIATALYRAFEAPQVAVENARIQDYKQLAAVEAQLKQAQEEAAAMNQKVQLNQATPQQALPSYEKILTLSSQLQPLKVKDQTYSDLRDLLKQELEIYQNLGTAIVTQKISDNSLEAFIQLAELNDDRLTIDQGKLIFRDNQSQESHRQQLLTQISDEIDQQLEGLEKQKTIAEGKVASPQRTAEISAISAKISTLKKFKLKLLTDIEETIRLEQSQSLLMKKINGESVPVKN